MYACMDNMPTHLHSLFLIQTVHTIKYGKFSIFYNVNTAVPVTLLNGL